MEAKQFIVKLTQIKRQFGIWFISSTSLVCYTSIFGRGRPKKINAILSNLKDKITIDRYSINSKGKDLIDRLN